MQAVSVPRQSNISSIEHYFLQVAQGDSDAADVIMDINEKVNGDKLTAEQQKLLDDQTKQAEALEERQLNEQREMNQHLNEEMASEEMDVETQIQQQKRLVCSLFCRTMIRNLISTKKCSHTIFGSARYI